jgi:hypothetical protein
LELLNDLKDICWWPGKKGRKPLL